MTSTLELPISLDRPAVNRAGPARARPGWFWRAVSAALIGGFLIAVACYAWAAGIQLRAQVWDSTKTIRFNADVGPAFDHGRDVLAAARALARRNGQETASLSFIQILHGEGQHYRDVYDAAVKEPARSSDSTGPDYGLDYPPGRLLLCALWVNWAHQNYPSIVSWSRTHEEITSFMLTCNSVAEAAGAVAMFFLVFVWVRRENRQAAASVDRDPFNSNTGGAAASAGVRSGAGWLASIENYFGNGALTAIASGVALLLALQTIAQIGAVPDLAAWICLGILFMVLIASVRRLPLGHRAWAGGLIAALLLWFNPQVLVVSYVWPQWDVWVVPFFLWAALAASLDFWFVAGMLLATGAMFKGQLLLGAPVLILWPIFAGRFGAALRIVLGMVVGAAICVCPWVVNGPTAWRWVICASAGAVVAVAGRLIWRWTGPRGDGRDAPRRGKSRSVAGRRPAGSRAVIAEPADLMRFTQPRSGWPMPARLSIVLLFAAGATGLVTYHFHHAALAAWLIYAMAAVVLVIPWIILARPGPGQTTGSTTIWILVVLAASIWLSGVTYGGNFAWFHIGFEYGTRKHQDMQLGNSFLPGSFGSLPGLLEGRFGWRIHDPVGTIQLPGLHPWALDLRALLAIVYFVALAACSAGAALQARRNSARILAALAAPWMLFPLIMAQMDQRYLLMAAAISAGAIAVSGGLTLLHVLVSLAAAVFSLYQTMQASSVVSMPAIQWVAKLDHNSYPDSGWLMLLAAAAFVFAALAPAPNDLARCRAIPQCRTHEEVA